MYLKFNLQLTFYFFVVDLCMTNILIQSPTITNWGIWGRNRKCPTNTYVVGMQLKIDSPHPPFEDDTGLNGIRFFCSDLFENKKNVTIESTSGLWGTWRSPLNCVNGVVVGFQLRSEPNQWRQDDTGANNLRILCSDGSVIEGEGTSWGGWTAEQKCRKRQAICSIQTQVEGFQGAYDDSALNNVKVECCDVSNPAISCIPSEYWEVVAACDNVDGVTSSACSYEKHVGLSYFDGSISLGSNNREISILEGIGYSLKNQGQILSEKFAFNAKDRDRMGFNWNGTAKTSAWHEQTVTKVTFEVTTLVRGTMLQLVGTCGPYVVRTPHFQREDFVVP